MQCRDRSKCTQAARLQIFPSDIVYIALCFCLKFANYILYPVRNNFAVPRKNFINNPRIEADGDQPAAGLLPETTCKNWANPQRHFVEQAVVKNHHSQISHETEERA